MAHEHVAALWLRGRWGGELGWHHHTVAQQPRSGESLCPAQAALHIPAECPSPTSAAIRPECPLLVVPQFTYRTAGEKHEDRAAAADQPLPTGPVDGTGPGQGKNKKKKKTRSFCTVNPPIPAPQESLWGRRRTPHRTGGSPELAKTGGPQEHRAASLPCSQGAVLEVMNQEFPTVQKGNRQVQYNRYIIIYPEIWGSTPTAAGVRSNSPQRTPSRTLAEA